MSYWIDRLAENQLKLQDKTVLEINSQIQNYYVRASRQVIADFEKVYNKVQKTMQEGRNPTPADLYKLDKYWQLQASLTKELTSLGNKQIKLLNRQFKQHFQEAYKMALPSSSFSQLDEEMVNQLINGVWVTDGKQWSQRVWDNTARLKETLNEELINIIILGDKRDQLERKLMERFNVSYHRAQTLARTEIAHIQTEAAKQRYLDYGIKYVEVLTADDDHVCPLCKALKGKRFLTSGIMPLPVHPNERCCLIPVVSRDSDIK